MQITQLQALKPSIKIESRIKAFSRCDENKF